MTDYSKYEKLIYKKEPEKSGFISKRKKYTNEELKQINEYQRKGYTIRGISIETGIPKSVVGRYIKNQNGRHRDTYGYIYHWFRNNVFFLYDPESDRDKKFIHQHNEESIKDLARYGNHITHEILDEYATRIQDDIINLKYYVNIGKDYSWMTHKSCRKYHDNKDIMWHSFWAMEEQGKTIDEIKLSMKNRFPDIHEEYLMEMRMSLEQHERDEDYKKQKAAHDMIEGIKKYGPTQEQKLAAKTIETIYKNLDSAPEETKKFISSCIELSKIKMGMGY